MSRLRISLLFLACLAGLFVLLAAALYGGSRLAWVERRAMSGLSESLGWPLEAGELEIGYFPLPWIEVRRLVVAGDEAGATPPLAEVARLRAELPWRTVLGRSLEISRLELQGLRVTLGARGDGRGNWEPFVGQVVKWVGEGPSAWSIGALELTESGLVYVQAGDRAVLELTGITLTADALWPATPFPVDLRLAGRSGERTFHATATGRAMLDIDNERYAADELVLAGWFGGDDLPLAGVDWAATLRSARADLEAGTARVRGLSADVLGVHGELDLDAAGLGAAPSLNFDLKTHEFSPRAAALGVNRPLPATTDPQALSRARVAAHGSWNPQSLTLESLEGQLDDTQFDGNVMLPAAGGVPRVRLSLDAVDLGRYLPPDDPQAPATPQSALRELLDGLEALDLDVEIRVGEARLAGARARGMKVTLAPLGDEAAP